WLFLGVGVGVKMCLMVFVDPSAEHAVLRRHAAPLPAGEARLAGVGGVVHIIGDWVGAPAGAGVAAHRAAGGRRLLGLGVADEVAEPRAAVLERVIQAQPV